jgi:hypothetical protein
LRERESNMRAFVLPARACLFLSIWGGKRRAREEKKKLTPGGAHSAASLGAKKGEKKE